jgi:hypothetical protein
LVARPDPRADRVNRRRGQSATLAQTGDLTMQALHRWPLRLGIVRLNGLADDGFDRFVEPFRARCNAHRQKGLDATATLGEPEQLEDPAAFDAEFPPRLLDVVGGGPREGGPATIGRPGLSAPLAASRPRPIPHPYTEAHRLAEPLAHPAGSTEIGA